MRLSQRVWLPVRLVCLMLPMLVSAVIVSPVSGFSPRGQCKSSCSRNYDLCLKRAGSKKARNTCKVYRNTCTRSCPAQ